MASSTFDLKASLEAFKKYQTTTFNYTKSCKKVVVGYTLNGIQVLKLPCAFGGIRDIGAYIYGNPEHVDLAAYIKVISTFNNLNAFLRTVFASYSTLPAYTKAFGRSSSTLSSYLIGDYLERDLVSYVNIIELKNLKAVLSTELFKADKDVYGYIKPYIQSNLDLQSVLNIIEISDLIVHISPELKHGTYNVKSYLKAFLTNQKDFSVSLHSWDIRYLYAQINQLYYRDLQSYILSTLNLDLNAYLLSVRPVDLEGSLHGYVERYLLSSIIGNYGPTDLNAFVTSILPVDLQSYIYVYRGIKEPYNLGATIKSYMFYDLPSYIYAGNSLLLNGYINSSGESRNLNAYLFPKTIHVKKVFNITLLNIRDLTALVNTTCFKTGYFNLGSSLYSFGSKNLRAYIVSSDIIGNDLKASINAADIIETDSITVKLFSGNNYIKLHTNIYAASTGLAFDTVQVLLHTAGNISISNLRSSIVASKYIRDYVNFKATVVCAADAIYKNRIGYNKEDTRFKVYNLNYSGEVTWQKEIEILFKSRAKFYRYVEGTTHAYREDKSKHWVIRVTGFNYVPNIGVERGKVKRNYVFDLRRYRTIDEAIRDAIDRVSSFKKSNITAAIQGVISTKTFRNLPTYVYAKYKSNSFVNFYSLVKGWDRQFMYNLGAITIATLPYAELLAQIEGKWYAPPEGSNIDFNFTEEDKVENTVAQIDLNLEGGL